MKLSAAPCQNHYELFYTPDPNLQFNCKLHPDEIGNFAFLIKKRYKKQYLLHGLLCESEDMRRSITIDDEN
jgi:hypothetical protein